MNTHVTPPPVDPTREPDSLWRERYGEAATPPQNGPWSDVLALQLHHRTHRAYLSDPLPSGTLETLIAAAQSAATSSNLQLWSVIAVESQSRRERFAELANNQAHIAQAPLFLVFLADLSRASHVAQDKGVTPEAANYIDTFYTASLDAALAAQNVVLAAESLGLGTVYIGALRNRITEVAKELGLPPRVSPVFGLVVGYPDPSVETDIKPRLPQKAVLHHDRYHTAYDASQIESYDKALHAFQDKQKLPRIDWSQQLTDRIATKAGLNGREALRPALESFGLLLK